MEKTACFQDPHNGHYWVVYEIEIFSMGLGGSYRTYLSYIMQMISNSNRYNEYSAISHHAFLLLRLQANLNCLLGVKYVCQPKVWCVYWTRPGKDEHIIKEASKQSAQKRRDLFQRWV